MWTNTVNAEERNVICHAMEWIWGILKYFLSFSMYRWRPLNVVSIVSFSVYGTFWDTWVQAQLCDVSVSSGIKTIFSIFFPKFEAVGYINSTYKVISFM